MECEVQIQATEYGNTISLALSRRVEHASLPSRAPCDAKNWADVGEWPVVSRRRRCAEGDSPVQVLGGGTVGFRPRTESESW